MPVRERILSIGITGSGKSYQWLKLADMLLPTGAIFRCLDTEDAILYMLETQFPQLLPENKGNVHVHPAFDWPQYKEGLEWLKKETIKDQDFVVVDMVDMAWETVQRYFVGEVFGKDIGDYFLEARKAIQASKKTVKSIMPEALKGWVDWIVINKLYDDWIKPLVYQTKCHLYLASKVQPLATEDDAETRSLFGPYKIRPSGQKHLGHQVHTIFLLIPGEDRWLITTIKDRAGRPYFKKIQLTSLYLQYLVAKAHWPLA